MMRVLTPIFPADVKPVRDGWYLTRRPGIGIEMMAKWHNGAWYCPVRGKNGFVQDRCWRGLAFDPASARPIVNTWTGSAGVIVPGAECC